MKFQKLAALLVLGSIELHSNFFGTKKPFAKFDEDQLQKIEDDLVEKDTSALDEKISEQEETIKGLNTEKSEIENAVNQALELNGIKIPEGASITDAVALIGQTCKTYGDSKETHTVVKTDGIDKGDDGDSEVFAHEKVLNDRSKFPTLK
ncbi:MAG: hypothetical protein LBE36_06430 [Flavobacteriaceae bacterium]|jgi:hypothetical protein|nr:hypothetical protein [Flavobacteriaceae bacterium]